MHSDAAIVPEKGEKNLPEVVSFYNATKGDVDRMDFMAHAMTAKCQTKRWPMLMFYNMLDLASIASLVVFRSKFPDSQFSKSARRRFFQLEVAKGLLVPQMERRRMVKHLPRQLTTTIDLVLDKDPEGDTQAQNAAQSTAVRSKRKRCAVCPAKRDRKTSSRCHLSGKPICSEHMVPSCNPIECFSAQEELRLGKLEYAKVFCWLRNTYVVGGDDVSGISAAMPVRDQEREEAQIHYYQWVPILLLVMACLIKLPNLVWRVFSLGSGLDLNQLAALVISTQCAPSDKYRETVRHIAEYIDRWLEGHRPRSWNVFVRAKKFMSKRCFFFPWGKRFGTYLTGLSLLTKLMFACADISVFLILQHVLGSWYSFYGIKLLAGMATSSSGPKDSPYFPKVTFCDMDVRQMNNVQR
ncbi:hypothetical protein PoB_001025000 [Plakobranchus ocellatus]|uniref:Innexin n=1 Tax=Plakobranchus ocellatus TaxID=259542 RepID=A0AAV3YLZ8_9GAST|nr:hypothetical protein PoB_001025000 [Plakobranchus ocellatus]